MNLFLCMVLENVLILLFYISLLSFPSIIYWRGFLFSFVYSYLLRYRLIEYTCMSLFIGFLSSSIKLYFYFGASTILFGLLYLCCTVWNQGTWFLKLCFPFPTLLCLFRVFCISAQIFLFFSFFSGYVNNNTDNLIGIAVECVDCFM